MGKGEKIRRVGILTGGGDCPGLNAVIRAVVKTAIVKYGLEIIGFLDGYSGLIQNRTRSLQSQDASGILHRGGTILGTSNRDDPFRYPVEEGGKKIFKDVSDQAVANFEKEETARSPLAIGFMKRGSRWWEFRRPSITTFGARM